MLIDSECATIHTSVNSVMLILCNRRGCATIHTSVHPVMLIDEGVQPFTLLFTH